MSDTQQIFEQFDQHLQQDEEPSAYFNLLVQSGGFPTDHPFDMLFALVGIEQSKKHHPEGDVWVHTMLVVDNAARKKVHSRDPRVLMWAALLHDIGKPNTTLLRRGRITAYDHDKEGSRLANQFLLSCGENGEFAQRVTALVRWHMQPLFAIKKLPFFNPKAMAKETDIAEVALLGLCDRLGRGISDRHEIARQEQNIALFVERCLEALGQKV